MFGLMRSCGCGVSPEARRLRQLHYCGTCKATGRLFGQRARLTLNHDAVFLGELLMALDQTTLPTSFTARRCFSLPMASEIPAPLTYAAAANVALAEFAVADKLTDNEGTRWNLVERGLRQAFLGARVRLQAAGVPLERLFAQHAAQAQAESHPTTLAALAAPTGTATQLIFAQGNPAHSQTLGQLGEAFGRLIYILDALTDYSDDLKQGAFNALAATKTSTAEAIASVREQQGRIIAALVALPLSLPKRQRFTQQLQSSVKRALMTIQAPEETSTEEPYSLSRPVQRQRQTRSCCTCDRLDFGDCTCCCDLVCCDSASCDLACCEGSDCGCSSCC